MKIRNNVRFALVLLCAMAAPMTLGSAATAQEIELNGHTVIQRDLLNVFAEDTSSGSTFLLSVRPTVSTFGTATTSNFAIRADNKDAIRITTVPRIGILNVSPQHPLHVGTDSTNGNGAHVTAAGVWTNGSSRTNKIDIEPLDASEVLVALSQLEPVRYRGKDDPQGEEYVGFIAEDVPELVAMNDRKGLSAMDIVGVLTKALQHQQEMVQRQEEAIGELRERLAEMEAHSRVRSDD